LSIQRVREEDRPIRNEILDELVRIMREPGQIVTFSEKESMCSILINEAEDQGMSSQDESMDEMENENGKNRYYV
jgi:hypothetical protein